MMVELQASEQKQTSIYSFLSNFCSICANSKFFSPADVHYFY